MKEGASLKISEQLLKDITGIKHFASFALDPPWFYSSTAYGSPTHTQEQCLGTKLGLISEHY